MNLIYKHGHIGDLNSLKDLAIKSWGQFQSKLTDENWAKLYNSLSNDETYTQLIEQSECIVCSTEKNEIIGMAFLVPNGNPTDIYDKDWCYVRLVSVAPDFSGQGIGRQLMNKCIELAKENGEKTVALHTSELMDKARHIYESLGFRILKEIDQRLGKRYWLYKLDLVQINE